MTFYKFKDKEILHNRVKTFPSIKFNIYNGNVFYNNINKVEGAFPGSLVKNTPPGYISLYELNIDRVSGSNNLIYPFITKDGSLTSFTTITTSSYNADYKFGDVVTGSYPLSASISSDFYVSSSGVRRKINALKNTLGNYLVLSPQYAYQSNLPDLAWNKRTQVMRMISIPSIFYGSSIKKGSVSLKYYFTGSLAAELRDDKKNGELIQVADTGYVGGIPSGTVAGVIMYDQGIILLTGSWDLIRNESPPTSFPSTTTANTTSLRNPKWIDFGLTGSSGGTLAQLTGSSFVMDLSGTNYMPTVTMFATAPKGKVNYSNNPTSLKYNTVNACTTNFSQSNEFVEPNTQKIANISSASYSDPGAPFEKTVYINSVGIYDENKNLIAVAKMAKPIRKRNSDDLTFKLKLDF